jgi:hypothetical protein
VSVTLPLNPAPAVRQIVRRATHVDTQYVVFAKLGLNENMGGDGHVSLRVSYAVYSPKCWVLQLNLNTSGTYLGCLGSHGADPFRW